MTELFYMALILVWDWKTACEHMAYTVTRVASSSTGDPVEIGPNDLLVYGDVLDVPPKRLPFYDRKLPVLGDVFHAVSGIRYLLMLPLAWHGFGNVFINEPGLIFKNWQLAEGNLYWYVATALINMAGWAVLKVLHGKHTTWGLRPRWLGGKG